MPGAASRWLAWASFEALAGHFGPGFEHSDARERRDGGDLVRVGVGVWARVGVGARVGGGVRAGIGVRVRLRAAIWGKDWGKDWGLGVGCERRYSGDRRERFSQRSSHRHLVGHLRSGLGLGLGLGLG